jgi:hypothetical protein
MRTVKVTALAPDSEQINWRPLASGGFYRDVPGTRLTIRPFESRWSLRINSEFVASFASLDEARQNGDGRVRDIQQAQADLEAWYASWPSREELKKKGTPAG